MILIMNILLHNVHKIIILRYPTYVYQFLIFLIITKIECWPVFKQDPRYRKNKYSGDISCMSQHAITELCVCVCMCVCVFVCVLFVAKITCNNSHMAAPKMAIQRSEHTKSTESQCLGTVVSNNKISKTNAFSLSFFPITKWRNSPNCGIATTQPHLLTPKIFWQV